MGINEFYFFNTLNNSELRELREISTTKKFLKDEILFKKGEDSKYLYMLVKGIVKLYDIDENNKEVVHHSIGGQSFVCEISNYEEVPFRFNCKFEVDSEVTIIDYDSFKKQFLSKNEFSVHFIKNLTKKIRYLESFIHSNISVDVSAKIAKFIYENERVLHDIRQIQIAEILNIREETLSRKIAQFIKEGIIKKEKRVIIILDHEKLLKQFI